MHVTRPLFVAVLQLGLALAFSKASAEDWPEGYILHEDSSSPGEQYGIVVPSQDAALNNEADETVNYLANLKTHQLMGKIAGADYFERQNHRSLAVTWADDSTWCIVQYYGRFGFDSISVVEPKGSSFTQTDIGERIQKSLNAVLAKQSGHHETEGDASVYFRMGPGRKVRVRATTTTNPKSLDTAKTYCALFQGTFDAEAKNWKVMDARSIKAEENDSLQTAYGDLGIDSMSFSTEEDKAKWLDDRMNEVYQAARLILTPDRFAKVKQEQIAWLKKRDASNSVEEECKLTEAQINALQELVW
jgi:uncharacterized protein YecT (DUF1311 family)